MGPTERRATAAAILLAYVLLCALFALVPDTGFQPMLGAFALIYALAFVGIYARTFWARWFAHGLGSWGAMTGIVLMVMTGPGVFLLSFAATHGVLVVLLSGGPMAAQYEGRSEWRQRYNLGDRGARMVGSLVEQLGALLPCVAFYALLPRGGGGAAALVALLVVAAGTGAIFRMRTWGLLALPVAGAMLVVSAWGSTELLFGQLVGWLLAAAALPFAPAMARFLRAR